MRRLPSPRPRYPNVVEGPAYVRKEDAACCVARALPDGRLPIGFCSPECVRRRT